MVKEFEYKIIDVYETQGTLTVEVEHEYGKQKMGLSLNSKYLGNDGQPKWKKEIKDKLNKRYGNRNEDKSLPITTIKDKDIGKTQTLS